MFVIPKLVIVIKGRIVFLTLISIGYVFFQKKKKEILSFLLFIVNKDNKLFFLNFLFPLSFPHRDIE